jgi:hypothetical protein
MARTWNPLIKSQPSTKKIQRLADRSLGLIRPKMGIRRKLPGERADIGLGLDDAYLTF